MREHARVDVTMRVDTSISIVSEQLQMQRRALVWEEGGVEQPRGFLKCLELSGCRSRRHGPRIGSNVFLKIIAAA